MTTYTIQIDGMHCTSCGLLVDDTLEDVPGVVRAETRVREGRTTVHVDADRCTPDRLVAAVAEAGYTARVVQP